MLTLTGCSNPTESHMASDADCWRGAGLNQIPVDSAGMLIRYGRELVSNTSVYLGPNGRVATVSSGMNCQNCHLEAGTKPWGNNYGAVAAVYPKYRDRSGSIESIEKRVNDCIERSLNGIAIDNNSREMKAFVAYIKWLGNEVPKGTTPKGTGIMALPLLDRAADPVKGKTVYVNTCQRCHGVNGEGQPNAAGNGYAYPPLWGPHSYNDGAGLYRLSRLAGYVKNNMPDPTSYHAPALTDEQAWDVAAFINSQPRPAKDISKDWPDITKKPFDHPFGPFADSFPAHQHKYGPFGDLKKKK
ncbi:c-type cytochrome [Sediminibacterium sp. WSJ-3]|nr:c-type cytochrome [Sediminibacterium soli]